MEVLGNWAKNSSLCLGQWFSALAAHYHHLEAVNYPDA